VSMCAGGELAGQLCCVPQGIRMLMDLSLLALLVQNGP
jgi:hypothetical protein